MNPSRKTGPSRPTGYEELYCNCNTINYLKGELAIIAYTGRLRTFSGLKYIKGQGKLSFRAVKRLERGNSRMNVIAVKGLESVLVL